MDRKAAQIILKDFCEAVHKANPGSGYAYLSGYFQSAYLELLEQISPHECMRELDNFLRETKRVEREAIVNTLKETQ